MNKRHDRPNPNSQDYMERTKRNHFFVGGIEGQKHLKNLCVGVAGLGGMGSNVAEALVRMGVGKIKIADPDTIETSNIQRQVIATKHTVGQSKALAMRDKLLTLADDFELETYVDGITEQTVTSFVEGCDIIVDEVDVYPLHIHQILHHEANKYNLPIYSAFIVGTGIRFYKFQGSQFTFDDFVKDIPSARLSSPSAQDLVNLFVPPGANYLNESVMKDLFLELNSGRAPILGASALLGHSTVCIRLVMDFLKNKMPDNPMLTNIKVSPLMPHYLAIDLGTMEVKHSRFTYSTHSQVALSG
jgi:molybdopterin/thiamine biosynthesis adenylyltransferase